MKTKSKLLVVAPMMVLAACGAPQYTGETLENEVRALAQVSASSAQARSTASKLTGGFKADITRAVGATPEYLAALGAAAEARHLVTVSEAARKPQLETSANLGSMVERGAGLASQTTNGASANLSLRQVIYDGGLSSAMIDGAQASALVALTEAEIVANRTAREAGATWVDLHALQAREDALTALMVKATEMLGQMETLVASGMIDKSASTSADIAVRSLVLEKSQIDASKAATTALYIKQFGAAPKALSAPPALLTEADLAKIKRDWSTAPILLQSAAQVLSAKQALLAAQGREKPTVGLSAGVSSPMDRDEQTNLALGFEVRWILGDGGRRKADTAAKAARLEATEQALEGLKLAGKSELDTALSQRAALRESLVTLAAQEVSAAKEIEILWSQLATGQTSVRQLIDAEVNSYRTTDRKILAQAELAKLELEMLASSGLLARKLGLSAQNAPMKATK
jgi:outer membrane protein TolC